MMFLEFLALAGLTYVLGVWIYLLWGARENLDLTRLDLFHTRLDKSTATSVAVEASK